MPDTPFDTPSVQPHPSRFIYGLAAALALAVMLADSSLQLLYYLLLPEPTSEIEALTAPLYDTFFFVTVGLDLLLHALSAGLTVVLVARHLLERGALAVYSKPRRVLIALLVIGLVCALAGSAALRIGWVQIYGWLSSLDLDFDTIAMLVRLMNLLSACLSWAISVAIPLWLCLRLFRGDARGHFHAGPLRRFEAASISALCVALSALWLLSFVSWTFSYPDHLTMIATSYGAGLAIALAAFVGAWQVLPQQLGAMRPLSLLGASLVSMACLTMAVAFAIICFLLLTYRLPDPAGLVGLLVLGAVGMLLCGLAQAFCLHVVYRPVAA